MAISILYNGKTSEDGQIGENVGLSKCQTTEVPLYVRNPAHATNPVQVQNIVQVHLLYIVTLPLDCGHCQLPSSISPPSYAHPVGLIAIKALQLGCCARYIFRSFHWVIRNMKTNI